ncbi:MAG: aminodeoxychorismate synthase, component I [Gemmatimonadetes bacterium]|nr:aminodeoxychorismate synthase, component I [Gemmatimonadota bacterium]
MSELTVRLEAFGRGDHGASFVFADPVREIRADRPDEVSSALRAVERFTGKGYHAAGYVAYEAAVGLDSAFQASDAETELPLLWFGVFETRREYDPGDIADVSFEDELKWRAAITPERYADDIARIRSLIEAGDTYQVNHSFRMLADFAGDPWALYRALCRSQRADYCAFIDTGRHQILSASPELFFKLQDGRLTTRPMKGTHPRGRYPAEDEAFSLSLASSAKDRAENLMIVDLLRNDLGRVSKTGSVGVTDLWRVESYETLFQMTSTVTSEVRPEVGLLDLFTGLFPCGSVTGAPKIRTMEIIDEIETTPRGVYTGSVGYTSPAGEAAFNVAIRTVCVDRENEQATFGVGGGITWDSTSEDEYQECLTKARVLSDRRPEFALFETALYEPDSGITLRDRHLDRLGRSARYFAFPFDRQRIDAELSRATDLLLAPQRVRLILEADGDVSVEVHDLSPPGSYDVAVCPIPVDETDVFLFHKTTNRQVYERSRAACPGMDDVILFNTSGELTELTIGNLVVELDGRQVTPPVECGLLAGTFREALIEAGEVEEAVIRQEDLPRARATYMINSVREWVPISVVTTTRDKTQADTITLTAGS